MKIRLSQNEMREYVAARKLLPETRIGLIEAAAPANAISDRPGTDAGTQPLVLLLEKIARTHASGRQGFFPLKKGGKTRDSEAMDSG